MPGIAGFVSPEPLPGGEAAVLLERMLAALEPVLPAQRFAWTSPDGRAGLGMVALQRLGRPSNWFAERAGGTVCVLEGSVHDYAADGAPSTVDPDGARGAPFLAGRYRRQGTAGLESEEIGGSFNFALWDERAGRLVLGNDRMGHRPLFYRPLRGGLLFASLLGGVLAAGGARPQVDVEGLADLLSYGFVIGSRTLFEGLQTLRPGRMVTYQAGRVHQHHYGCIDTIEPHGVYDRRRLDELESIFLRAVRRCFRVDLPCSVSLTGGVDSRCVLAAALKQGLPVSTYTGGMAEDSVDVLLARRVAQAAGVPHHWYPVGPQHRQLLDAWLAPMVYCQGAMVATLHSHVCADVVDPPEHVVELNGMEGEYARNFLVRPEHLSIEDPLQAWQAIRGILLTPLTRPEVAGQLWQPAYRPLGLEAPDEHFYAEMRALQPIRPPAAHVHLFSLLDRTRKVLNKAHTVVRMSREVYFPYLDYQWLQAVASIPIAEQIRHNVQADLIARLAPALMKVPWSATMLPLSARPWQVQWARRYRRVRRRLRLGDGTPRRVPNQDYPTWVRRELRPFLTGLLYDPGAAFRAYLRWESVRALLDQHFTGQADWSTLLAALAVFELAQRLWVRSPGPVRLPSIAPSGGQP